MLLRLFFCDNGAMRSSRHSLWPRRIDGRPGMVQVALPIAAIALLLASGLWGCTLRPTGLETARMEPSLRDRVRAHAPGFVYSPYKHVPIALADGVVSIAVAGAPAPVAASGHSALPPGITALTLAFATGECGAETWDGIDARVFADMNLRAFDRAGIDFIISTGGEAGTFTCATDAGMEAFVARYVSPRLIGLDFDIERGQSAEVVASLVQRIKTVKARHPYLRISFTLATWGASDGSAASLNADGQRVMQAIGDAGLAGYYVNLMVMDFGEAIPRNCVVSAGVCDMGRSAIRAAQNLHARYDVPMARIELTPMIGVNDVETNVFTLEDACLLSGFARQSGLGGLHFWSLDRDASCPPGAVGVSPVCSGLRGLPAFAFTEAFRRGLR
jgi:hypothetical protein